MFVTLSKILPLLIYPPGLLFLLLSAAVLLRHKPRWRSGMLVSAMVILLLSSNGWTAFLLARSLEWRYFPPQPVPQAQVIVVLGGGSEPSLFPRSTVEVNGAGDRLLYAARLYKQGVAPVILLSGGSISWMDARPVPASEEMADILIAAGVPESALWLQSQSQNTYEDALFCKEMLSAKGITRILLITSAMHMPRAAALFQKQGLDVIPLPTDYSITDGDWKNLISPNLATQILNLFPNTGNMGSVTTSLKEYIGMLIYWVRGWI